MSITSETTKAIDKVKKVSGVDKRNVDFLNSLVQTTNDTVDVSESNIIAIADVSASTTILEEEVEVLTEMAWETVSGLSQLSAATDQRINELSGTTEAGLTTLSGITEQLGGGVRSLSTGLSELSASLGELSALTTTAKTSIVSAINEINAKSGVPTYENVTITLSVSAGSGSVAGKAITVRYTTGSEEHTISLTANASGVATAQVPGGAMYRVEPSAMSGYMALNTPWNPAVMNSRSVGITYTLVESGFFVITTDHLIIPRLSWNTDDNDKAAWVMYYDSDVSGNPIIYPKTLSISSKLFQVENVDCSLITNRSNSTVANADYNGKGQSATWLEWARTPSSTTNKSPVQTYNEAQGTSLTEYEYLAAIGTCYNKTIQWNGETLHGYLPAMGQLRKLCDNRVDATALHTLIGGNAFPNLASGNWWSCSESNYNNCWNLYSGTTSISGKSTSYQLFALYDLSEINL